MMDNDGQPRHATPRSAAHQPLSRSAQPPRLQRPLFSILGAQKLFGRYPC